MALSVVGGVADGGASGSAGDVTGRKGRDGQEAVLDHSIVADAMPNLEALLKASKEADEKLNDAIKKVAQSSGYLASNVKKLVKARVSDTFSDKKRDAEQQLDLFNCVGQLQ